LDKAIEIKRRAQRCVQNGDLDGALSEYEKLVAVQDSDPYNFVLLADLLFKKGESGQASARYLAAATAYEANGLYKNAIAVCKKMMRLSLAPLEVMGRLANLHALDGLATESALYHMQYADLLIQQGDMTKAIASLEKAFEVSPDNIRALEKLGEARVLDGDNEGAARTLHEAALHYQRAGQITDADRCRRRAGMVAPAYRPDGAAAAPATVPDAGASDAAAPADLELERPARLPEPAAEPDPVAHDAGAGEPAHAGHGLELEHTSLAEATVDEDAPAGPPRLPLSSRFAAAGVDADAVADAAAAAAPSINGDGPHGTGDETPEAPGLREAGGPPPLRVAAGPADPAPAAPPQAGGEPVTLASVEHLLAEAQEHFRAGARDAASHSLAGAARAYEALGRLDSAATIYRSLGKSAHATPEVLLLWLGNCERRGDRSEAAQVACELGDRALNDGDAAAARDWFERAQSLDAANDLSRRRLQRLAAATSPTAAVATLLETPEAPATTDRPGAAHASAAVAPSEPSAAGPVPPSGADSPEGGRVEVAVGRGEAVTFDLGSLISEFQRGVEAQLSGDAQSHYDLGMAYREMGLLEQAVDSFRIAVQEPAYRDRCVEMIGRCLLDQGRFDDATQAFEEAMADGPPDAGVTANLRFLLGLAHEAAGRPHEALAEFERVYAAQPSFPDVAFKIRVLRKSLENH
jgi:tetratricopeptide (TPR) repeat protein